MSSSTAASDCYLPSSNHGGERASVLDESDQFFNEVGFDDDPLIDGLLSDLSLLDYDDNCTFSLESDMGEMSNSNLGNSARGDLACCDDMCSLKNSIDCIGQNHLASAAHRIFHHDHHRSKTYTAVLSEVNSSMLSNERKKCDIENYSNKSCKYSSSGESDTIENFDNANNFIDLIASKDITTKTLLLEWLQFIEEIQDHRDGDEKIQLAIKGLLTTSSFIYNLECLGVEQKQDLKTKFADAYDPSLSHLSHHRLLSGQERFCTGEPRMLLGIIRRQFGQLQESWCERDGGEMYQRKKRTLRDLLVLLVRLISYDKYVQKSLLNDVECREELKELKQITTRLFPELTIYFPIECEMIYHFSGASAMLDGDIFESIIKSVPTALFGPSIVQDNMVRNEAIHQLAKHCSEFVDSLGK